MQNASVGHDTPVAFEKDEPTGAGEDQNSAADATDGARTATPAVNVSDATNPNSPRRSKLIVLPSIRPTD